MMKINLEEKRAGIVAVMEEGFKTLTSLSKEVRPDEKERMGIQVLVREPDTRNLIFFSVANPSERAMFFSAEKAIRSHIYKDVSSENSSNPTLMQFAGSIGVHMNDMYVQLSVSGMKAEEDVALGITGVAHLFETTPKSVCKNIQSNGGKLPGVFFQKGHYLNQFLRLN